MDSVENERMSKLLSTLLDWKYSRTEEEVDINRRALIIEEHIRSLKSDPSNIITLGSAGEGLKLKGSDRDVMNVHKGVIVMYPDESIPSNIAQKTILYMKKAQSCRPGYVNLQLRQTGPTLPVALLYSLVKIKGLVFASSDLYRDHIVCSMNTAMDLNYRSNGPSSSNNILTTEVDYVFAFACNSWPREAKEWVTRTRLYGWPSQTLIDKIVKNGCHVVPVGDKCSEDTLLQWRISFATSERSLIHSFTHIQLKVYVLLKYFLKQIKETLKQVIGDDDILCSYFLKTVLFHAIENSSQLFWQDKHLFTCFWFCFNILITWVRAGFCPNYFIPENNLFKRKVHGLHQQILLDILGNFYDMKWMCLSVGNFFIPTIWEDLCNSSMQAELSRPKTVEEITIHKDVTVSSCLQHMPMSNRVISMCANIETIRIVIELLSTSKTDFDEIYTYNYAMKCLQTVATNQVYPDHMAATKNKARYRSLRKCKRWMIPSASMGTDLLYLATFYFLTGNISKTLEMCKQQGIQIAYLDFPNINSQEKREIFTRKYPEHGHMFQRLRTIYTHDIVFQKHDVVCLPHLHPELLKCATFLAIPALPYALFLSFLCCHELGDTCGQDVALCHLRDIQHDDQDGGCMYWIVHTLLGICYQTLGDYHRAIGAYWESAQSKGYGFKRNPAITRIAVVYLCICASYMSETDQFKRTRF
ncbi:uncharacterized protein LOC117327654 [Pecten maximus]|uniref:uncharacterized protein LOC117327654 n=1 Tax=Pecten maximus TaxID=6579 RepID=UPI001458B932|nr:uncharacterized protein LOC117327654 [Pecten maximus]